jgi:hypothetical protein
MLVSPLRIFATLAVAAAVGVSALAPECVITCFTSAMELSGCAGLCVLLAHRRWTSFPHALLLF